jgi:biotin synthase
MSNLNDLLVKIKEAELPSGNDLEAVLSLKDRGDLNTLFSFADLIRQQFCGDEILLRGIVEFSNFCARNCFYCGLNKNNLNIKRYRMRKEEILDTVEYLVEGNIKTVVLQSGDDPGIDALWLKDIILELKSRFDIAITLSVGERGFEDYKAWKDAGADRYLLKIESSDRGLYNSAHEGMSFDDRIRCLYDLKGLGYQTGSGNIIGLPGQTLKIIAGDIIFFKKMDLDMIGIGPFIPHADSRFCSKDKGEALLTLKTIALTRIVTKNTHIPATTALGSLDKDYRLDGLGCGANVIMPNFTPQPYRKLYEIYPGKRCVGEPVGACAFSMEDMAKSLGRFIEYSKGDSLKERKPSLNV